MSGRPKRTTRLSGALLIAMMAIAVALPSAPSSAAPGVQQSKSQLDAARAKLAALNQKMGQLVEDFNYANYELSLTQKKLDAAQATVDRAAAAATAARDALNSRTVAAYQGETGTALDLLLGSQNFTDFADRLEFLDQMAAHDADLASQAQVTGEQAHRAALELQTLKTQQQKKLAAVAKAKAEIAKNISQQESLVSNAQAAYKQALAAQRAALAAPVDPGSSSSTTTSSSSGGPPPPTSSGAAGAVQAAQSVIGTPYVYGGSSPSTGFDCSGLTMWAWGQVGVSLPHSAAAQYASLPHVSKSELQPGDLVFFYSPISHVGIYIGGGQMIHAPHTGSTVQVAGVYWSDFVGAARP